MLPMPDEIMELIAAKVPPQMKKQLEQIAESERRPMSMMTRMLLEEAIAARAKKAAKKN